MRGHFERLILSTIKSVLLMSLCENVAVGDKEKRSKQYIIYLHYNRLSAIFKFDKAEEMIFMRCNNHQEMLKLDFALQDLNLYFYSLVISILAGTLL